MFRANSVISFKLSWMARAYPAPPGNVVVYEDFALNAAQGIFHRANANLNFVRRNLQDSGSRFAHQRTERVPDGSS